MVKVMKKLFSSEFFRQKISEKRRIYRIIKLSAVLLLLCSSFTFASQVNSRHVKLSLNKAYAELREVLDEIEKQTDYLFISNRQIDLNQTVSIQVLDGSVEEVLSNVLKNTGLTFTVEGMNIVLSNKEITRSAIREQERKTITGRIVDQNGEPVIGANIVEKGTSNGVISDVEGRFSISVNENAELQVSYIGYVDIVVPVAGKDKLELVLTEDTQDLDEVVVIGYGTMKKSDLTGSVVKIDVDKYKDQPKTSVSDYLLGTVAGFYAQQSGSANDAAATLQVRGPTSLKASTSPLIVLDGVIYNGNINDINPDDIESIDILKDASSSAVFGSRAAAGVMIITTKKGIKGKPTINFSTQIGIAQASNKKFRAYKGEDFLKFRSDAMEVWFPNDYPYYYDNPDNLPETTSLEEWRNASANPNDDNKAEWGSRLNLFPVELENFLQGNEIDMFPMTIQNALRQSYDVSITGGTEDINYYWSMGYDDNETVLRDGGYSALRMRLNTDFKVASWLSVGVNTQFSTRDESPLALSYSSRVSPYCSLYEEDGSLNWYPSGYVGLQNPLVSREQERVYKTYSLFSSIYAKVTLPWGFKYEMSFQPHLEYRKDFNFWGSDTFTGSVGYSQGYGTRAEYTQFEWMLDNILRWNKEFGDHRFDLTLLYSSERFRDWNTLNTGESFAPNDNLGWGALQQAQKISVSNNDTEYTGDAFMARLNYSLMGKYLLTASVRRDGFSAFGQKNPYGVFPAVALAWRISEEEFFKVPFISSLKLRTSWGINGNRSIGQYSALATVSSGLYWDGISSVSNVWNSSLANSDLKWERTEAFNVGIDLTLLNNRISIVSDFYLMSTKDLLMDRRLPELTGFVSVATNLGELENKGFELTLNTLNVDNEDFQWNSNFVFSFNRNKIKKLFGEYGEYTLMGKTYTGELPDYNNGLFPGESIDRVWGYKVIGVWQEEEADEAARYNLTPGNYKSEDLDNNGLYEDKMDKQFIGYTTPRFRLGFGNEFSFLKNFTASIFLRADLGHIARASIAERAGGYEYNRVNEFDFPYWTPENRNQEWGGLRMSPEAYGGGLQIYKPASFLRIQDVSVGYNLPENFVKKLRIKNARLSFSIRNLYCFTNWIGWDPESLNSPIPRIYTFGVNVSL